MSDRYAKLIWHALYPAWERGIRRRPTLALLADLERDQHRSLSALRARQLAALRRLLFFARAHIPHYHRKMATAGFDPGALDDLAGLSRLPILTRAEAQAAKHELLSLVPPLPSIQKTTGGTTGEPLVIRYDAGSEAWRQAIKLRAFGWAGYRVGERALHYWGAPTRPDSRLRARLKRGLDHRLKRERYLDCTDRSDLALATAVDHIRRHRPRFLFCYAQAAADLARYINRTGARDWDDITAICGAEPLLDTDKRALAAAFGRVVETYGCREVMLIAAECEEQCGLHVAMENVVVELVVREGQSERPARPGEVGEVVLTDLHNYGMPLIRYANGDLATWMPDDACACGRAHPRLAQVDGRVTDALRDGRGNRVGGMVFNLIFSPLADRVRQFQATQRADGSIVVKVIPHGELSPDITRHVRHCCALYLPGVDVQLEKVDAIPLSGSGKHRVTAAAP